MLQFEKVAEAEDGASLHSLTDHAVNRRYSEFLNLQARLEEKPEVKKLIKSKKLSSVWDGRQTLVGQVRYLIESQCSAF